MADELDPDVRSAVEGSIRSQFATDAIADIQIEPADEVDDEIVIKVYVLFNVRPDTSRLRSLVRNVRSDIHKHHAFPVFSFASRNALLGADV